MTSRRGFLSALVGLPLVGRFAQRFVPEAPQFRPFVDFPGADKVRERLRQASGAASLMAARRREDCEFLIGDTWPSPPRPTVLVGRLKEPVE